MRAFRTNLDWRIVACLIPCAVGVACNDTDDVHVGLRSTRYQCAGAPLTKPNATAPSPVGLTCGTEADIDQREINVVIVGMSPSTDIKGVHFDVVYPRDRFAYVPGSATIVPDNFLTWGGGVCTANVCSAPAQSVGKACTNNKTCNVAGLVTPVLTATELFPAPAPSAATNAALRIAIDRPAADGGVGATIGGQLQFVRFRLRVGSLTEPIDPTLLKFQNMAAINSMDMPLPAASVFFVDQLFLWVQ